MTPMQIVLYHGRVGLVSSVDGETCTLLQAGVEPQCVAVGELEVVGGGPRQREEESKAERESWKHYHVHQRTRLGTCEGERVVAEEGRG